MTTGRQSVQEIEPFFIAPYAASSIAPHTPSLPTPLLDPDSLQTARMAYESAEDELRLRARSSLRPAARHLLASRILSFALFGERDPRSLADRALAHFP
jgi:hypothetical protein